MDKPYQSQSTSRNSAKVSDRELSCTDTTRKIVRANIHDNPRNSKATVSLTIVHQRKSKNSTWENTPSPPLSKLKAGEAAKFSLDSEETLALHEELLRFYAIHRKRGVQPGNREFVVADPRDVIRTDSQRGRVIRELLERGYGDEVWHALIAQNPDLATRLGNARIQQERQDALGEFRQMMAGDFGEIIWQRFFDRNKWIFGYGLDYRVLDMVRPQPNYGGRGVDGRGGQRGDNLMATKGDVRFTVLVEIKKPSTPLLSIEPYRNRAYAVSDELAGGISQLQSNCQTWEIEGSRTDAARDELDGILTARPKGILIVGHGKQLNSRDRKISFELARRNTINPEIITFDELLARAEFIVHEQFVAKKDSRLQPDDTGSRNEMRHDEVADDDDVPF